MRMGKLLSAISDHEQIKAADCPWLLLNHDELCLSVAYYHRHDYSF